MPERVSSHGARNRQTGVVIGAVASVFVLGIVLFGAKSSADRFVPEAPAGTQLLASPRPVADVDSDTIVDVPVEPGAWAYIPVKGVFVVPAPGDKRDDALGSMPEGAYVMVLQGPVPSSGEDWYRVAGDDLTGWIPAGRDGNAWVVDARTTSTSVPVWDPPVVIPGAGVEYYDIQGSSPAELRSMVALLGPDVDDTGDAIAVTSFVPDFEEYRRIASFHGDVVDSIESYDACRVTWRFIVTLPRWVGPSPVALPVFTWWEAARQKMIEHETRHVQIWRDALPTLEDRLDPIESDAYCADARSDVEQWLREVEPKQDALDAKEGYLDWPIAP